ncbi:MAG: phytanoyl-CoA dioxygenase family protein [Caldilineaceae bacterium]|nr:phytanoyl-CoA dioxygenase family protein [Caldilineaceae bacterium]
MTILSAADHAFWEENGYVVVPNAVPQENLDAVINVMWEFLGMDPADPATWYSQPGWHSRTGMVELYQHQALWDNRQYPRIHEAFSELFGTEKLWVSLDRVNMNPPAREDWDYQGFIHWDFDPESWPIGLRVQGVLCLTDTEAAQGGFQCVPGSHHQVPEIISRQQPDANLRRPDISGLTVKEIAGQAGDLIIWHTGLLHGNGRNRTDRPRQAQYITMNLAKEEDEELRQHRVDSWRNHTTPGRFPGDPRKLEEQAGTTAELTQLGQKLLGLERW